MKRSRFTEEQIIGILKEHEAGVSVSDLCRKHGVSDASIYKWKAKFGGMDVSEAKKLRGLEDEKGRLKRLLAPSRGLKANRCQAAGCHVGQCCTERFTWKKMVTPAAEREAVALLRNDHEMSERRACQLLKCCRMTMRYASVRPADTVLRERMKAIAHERRRFGYPLAGR